MGLVTKHKFAVVLTEKTPQEQVQGLWLGLGLYIPTTHSDFEDVESIGRLHQVVRCIDVDIRVKGIGPV
jgi:hypothetical protein